MSDLFMKPALCFAIAFAATLTTAAPISESEQAYLDSREEIVFAAHKRHAPFAFLNKRPISGMDDYIAKPVGRQNPIDLINKYTARP